MSKGTDEELMQAYQLGDESAFTTLYERHGAKVFGYLLRNLRDRALAEDIFQATFLKLHQSRRHYDPSFPFVPWLFTVCRSAMVDGLRRKSRIHEVSDPIALDGAIAPDPAAVAVAGALPTLGLSALPPAQRKAVELRYGDELSFEEIARRLETSPGNVRQLVSRAVRRLRTLSKKGGPA